eukprot:TRINITY_DN93017_c0_g1_i3.p1 TRINITY_DN93017_c0_g1~~TRINITY_DN93017_c0_g1_i3.p1  ORF type:complete len:628 (+),score=108.08 TRINITY_DN93017_c0_g1_i3:143-1885(+)
MSWSPMLTQRRVQSPVRPMGHQAVGSVQQVVAPSAGGHPAPWLSRMQSSAAALRLDHSPDRLQCGGRPALPAGQSPRSQTRACSPSLGFGGSLASQAAQRMNGKAQALAAPAGPPVTMLSTSALQTGSMRVPQAVLRKDEAPQSFVPAPKAASARTGAPQLIWTPKVVPSTAPTTQGVPSPAMPPQSRSGSPMLPTRAGSPIASPRHPPPEKAVKTFAGRQPSAPATPAVATRQPMSVKAWPGQRDQASLGTQKALQDDVKLRLRSMPNFNSGKEAVQDSRPVVFALGGTGGSMQAPVGKHAALASRLPQSGSLQVPCGGVSARATLPHVSAKPGVDAIDAVLQATLQNDLSLQKLTFNRLGPGEYLVEGRRVIITWAPSARGGGPADLLVCEKGVGTSPSSDQKVTSASEGEEESDQVAPPLLEAAPEMPLPAYLRQAADVNAALGASAVARIPQEKRLSFNAPGVDVQERESADLMVRCASMRQAVEEARLRAHAAEAYESGRPLAPLWQRKAGTISVPQSPSGAYRNAQAWSRQGERPAGGVRLAETLASLENRRQALEEEEESDESNNGSDSDVPD